MEIHYFLKVIVGQVTLVVRWLMMDLGVVLADDVLGGKGLAVAQQVERSLMSLALFRPGRLLSRFMLQVSLLILQRKQRFQSMVRWLPSTKT